MSTGNLYKAKVIKRNIEKSFDICRVMSYVSFANNGNCIEVTDNNKLFLWIRLMYNNETGMYMVDFNNVMFPDEYQGRHFFSTIFNRVVRCKYVEEVRITSVCTERMKQWCEYHNLEFLGDCNYRLKA